MSIITYPALTSPHQLVEQEAWVELARDFMFWTQYTSAGKDVEGSDKVLSICKPLMLAHLMDRGLPLGK